MGCGRTRSLAALSLVAVLSLGASAGCYEQRIAEPTTDEGMNQVAGGIDRPQRPAPDPDAAAAGARAPSPPSDPGSPTAPAKPAQPSRDAGPATIPTETDAQVPPTEDAGPVAIPFADAVAIDAGEDHGCAIKLDGSLWCWGDNYYGQLGRAEADADHCTVNTRDLPCGKVPRQVGDAHDWRSVSAGHTHTCALKQNGTLFCWGQNYNGALGDGTTTSSATPLQVGSDEWSAVAAGENHTCGIRASGELYCWGTNGDHELGTTEGVTACGQTTCALTPLRVSPESDWNFLAAGGQTTCAIRGGALYCWGYSYAEQASGEYCGDLDGCASGVTQVGVDADWASVSTWASHTCAIKTDGSLWCWGMVLQGDPLIRVTEPQRVAGDRTFLQVAAGEDHTCAVATDSALYCWGGNAYGQVGDGRKGTATCFGSPCTPEPVQIGSDFAAITTGLMHSCGLEQDGSLYCWGAGDEGQVGALNLEQCELPELEPTPCATRPWPVDPGG